MGLFSKPKVKYAGSVNIGKSMADTFNLNDRYFNDATAYTRKLNSASQEQALSILEQAMPGIGQARQMLMRDLKETLSTRGMPQGMVDRIKRHAAEAGVAQGARGGFNSHNLAQKLGIGEISWQQARQAQAMNTIQQIYQVTPRVNPMSPHSMLMNPGTALQVQSQNLDRRQAMYNAQAQAEAQNKSNILGAIMGVAKIGAFVATGGMSGAAEAATKVTTSGG